MSEPKSAGMFSGQASNGLVLVVDDEPDVRKVVRMTLEKAGYNVIEAEDGEQAMARIKEGENPLGLDVIITDIRMPKVDGGLCVDILKKIAPEIPVVMVTGYSDTEMAKAFLEKGVKDYLVKPVEKKKFLDVVGKIIAAGKDEGL